MERGGLDPTPTVNPQGNIATVEFKLMSAQDRDLSTIAVMQAWREEVGILPYVRGIAFSGEVINLGSTVEAVLSHPDPTHLNELADSVVDGLRTVAGVFNVRSDHSPDEQVAAAIVAAGGANARPYGRGTGKAGAGGVLRRGDAESTA